MMSKGEEVLAELGAFMFAAYVLQLYMNQVFEERERRRVAGAKTSAYLASLRGG